MGIRVVVSFQTPEGFQVTEVYVRATSVLYEFENKHATLRYLSYLNREMRLEGRTDVHPPQLTGVHIFKTPAFPTVDMLYYHLKQHIVSRGYVVEDVLEEGQAASTYTEPEEDSTGNF